MGRDAYGFFKKMEFQGFRSGELMLSTSSQLKKCFKDSEEYRRRFVEIARKSFKGLKKVCLNTKTVGQGEFVN